ncbi:MAG: hypothetical protein K2L45_03385 [Muribaculaceae bacterium]|nr:hypothetical protein [Muribaculaceae bacterium]
MKYFFFVLSSSLIFLLSSCNNDIFLGDSQLPNFTDVIIVGDNGSWSTPISRKGLSRVYIDFDYAERKYVSYRNIDYKVTDENCPASELLDISYQNPLRDYIVSFHGDMLYFSSRYNASCAYSVTLHLEYVFGEEKVIEFNVSGGEPLKFVMQHNDSNMAVREYMSSRPFTTGFFNNLPDEYALQIFPYYKNNCIEEVTTDEEWANGLTFDIELPLCLNGKWIGISNKPFTIGDRIDFCSPDSISENFTVNVPPKTSVTVTYNYRYSEAIMKSELILDNTVSDVRITLPVICRAVYPVDYDYEVKFDDL